MKLPREKSFPTPSSAVWSAAAVTTGATSATVIVNVSVSEARAPSSVTVMVTVYVPSSA